MNEGVENFAICNPRTTYLMAIIETNKTYFAIDAIKRMHLIEYGLEEMNHKINCMEQIISDRKCIQYISVIFLQFYAVDLT